MVEGMLNSEAQVVSKAHTIRCVLCVVLCVLALDNVYAQKPERIAPVALPPSLDAPMPPSAPSSPPRRNRAQSSSPRAPVAPVAAVLPVIHRIGGWKLLILLDRHDLDKAQDNP